MKKSKIISKRILFLFCYLLLYMIVKVWQGTRTIRSLFGFFQCRFYPACSNYFLEAIYKYGLVNGFVLFVRRILKCHPLCEGGIDEVPRINCGL